MAHVMEVEDRLSITTALITLLSELTMVAAVLTVTPELIQAQVADLTQVMTATMLHQEEMVLTTHRSATAATPRVLAQATMPTMLAHAEMVVMIAVVVAAVAQELMITAVLQQETLLVRAIHGQTEAVALQEVQIAGQEVLHQTQAGVAEAVAVAQAQVVALVVAHAEAVEVAAEAVVQDNNI